LEDNYSYHPQSVEFLELLTATPELLNEEDDTSDTEITDDSASDESTGNELGAAYADSLYKDSVITTPASNVVIMEYAIKHNLTMDALADLLKLVKLHCPAPNNVSSTRFHF